MLVPVLQNSCLIPVLRRRMPLMLLFLRILLNFKNAFYAIHVLVEVSGEIVFVLKAWFHSSFVYLCENDPDLKKIKIAFLVTFSMQHLRLAIAWSLCLLISLCKAISLILFAFYLLKIS